MSEQCFLLRPLVLAHFNITMFYVEMEIFYISSGKPENLVNVVLCLIINSLKKLSDFSLGFCLIFQLSIKQEKLFVFSVLSFTSDTMGRFDRTNRH